MYRYIEIIWTIFLSILCIIFIIYSCFVAKILFIHLIKQENYKNSTSDAKKVLCISLFITLFFMTQSQFSIFYVIHQHKFQFIPRSVYLFINLIFILMLCWLYRSGMRRHIEKQASQRYNLCYWCCCNKLSASNRSSKVFEARSSFKSRALGHNQQRSLGVSDLWMSTSQLTAGMDERFDDNAKNTQSHCSCWWCCWCCCLCKTIKMKAPRSRYLRSVSNSLQLFKLRRPSQEQSSQADCSKVTIDNNLYEASITLYNLNVDDEKQRITEVHSSENDELSLYELLRSNEGYKMFLAHTYNDWSSDNLLAVVEMAQFQEHYRNKLLRFTISLQLVLPTDIEMSDIVKNESLSMRQKAVALYNKYIKSGAELELNFSSSQKKRMQEMALCNFENISDRECSMVFEDCIHHLMALLHDSYVRFQDTLMYKTVKKKIIKQMQYEHKLRKQTEDEEDDESVTKQLEMLLTPISMEEDHSGDTPTDIATLVTTVDDSIHLRVRNQYTKGVEQSFSTESMSKCRQNNCFCTRFVKRSNGSRCRYCGHLEMMHYVAKYCEI